MEVLTPAIKSIEEVKFEIMRLHKKYSNNKKDHNDTQYLYHFIMVLHRLQCDQVHSVGVLSPLLRPRGKSFHDLPSKHYRQEYRRVVNKGISH